MGIKIHTEKDDYVMGEPVRCRVVIDSDYKKPGHLRVCLLCVEDSMVAVRGKKQVRKQIIYDWGITLVENKPLSKNSFFDVIFQTPQEPELQFAYPQSFASRGKQRKVDVAWGWNIFAVYSKPIRESGEMAWLMESMPERLRQDMDLTEDEKANLAKASQSGSGFVYNFSLQKDSSFNRAVKPIMIRYAPSEMSTGESITAKFTEVGELKTPSRHVKQGEGLDLELRFWNPTHKGGKVNGFRGAIECWNASVATGDRVGSAGFILKESGKIEPGEEINMPLKSPSITGPPTIYGKNGALIWTCRMDVELSWFGKQYAAFTFNLLPSAISGGPKKIKLFDFRPLFTDTGATEIPFCDTLARARVDRAIPALRARILEIIPKLWMK